jgi:uncharacterized protein YndB with AHSA1/START domain
VSEPAILAARFTRTATHVTAEIGLTLDNVIDDVWAALTRSERLARWLAPGVIDPWRGGRARLDFADSGVEIDSEVSAFEPPRRLVYSWSRPGEPARPIEWDLEAIGPMTRLTLRLTVPSDEDAARAAAGWAAHLEMLWAELIGVPVKFPFPAFKAAREAYGRQLSGIATKGGAADPANAA